MHVQCTLKPTIALIHTVSIHLQIQQVKHFFSINIKVMLDMHDLCLQSGMMPQPKDAIIFFFLSKRNLDQLKSWTLVRRFNKFLCHIPALRCDFTSRFFGLFCQFTEGCSESRVSRLGRRASIGYNRTVERWRGEGADRRRGTGRRGDHS